MSTEAVSAQIGAVTQVVVVGGLVHQHTVASLGHSQ